jgi:hypothetical protein
VPATAARIGFIQSEFRRVVATTPSAQTRFGSLARESDDPVETFFDSAADAQVIADARQALLSPERRRFRVNTVGAAEILALPYVGAVPIGRYVDTERAADRPVLLGEIIVDLSRDKASLTVWG